MVSVTVIELFYHFDRNNLLFLVLEIGGMIERMCNRHKMAGIVVQAMNCLLKGFEIFDLLLPVKKYVKMNED